MNETIQSLLPSTWSIRIPHGARACFGERLWRVGDGSQLGMKFSYKDAEDLANHVLVLPTYFALSIDDVVTKSFSSGRLLGVPARVS